eukprot:4049443-Amphidinium_carterae.2
MLKATKGREKHQVLLRHLEFFTGLPASFPLTDECSRWAGMLKRMQVEASRRGRLSARTILPVNFEREGLFELDDVDESRDELYVRMRFTRSVITVHASAFKQRPKNLRDVQVRHNHSELLAELYFPGVEQTVGLRSVFGEAQLRRPLAVQDVGINNELLEVVQERVAILFQLSGRSLCRKDGGASASSKSKAARAPSELNSSSKKRKL